MASLETTAWYKGDLDPERKLYSVSLCGRFSLFTIHAWATFFMLTNNGRHYILEGGKKDQEREIRERKGVMFCNMIVKVRMINFTATVTTLCTGMVLHLSNYAYYKYCSRHLGGTCASSLRKELELSDTEGETLGVPVSPQNIIIWSFLTIEQFLQISSSFLPLGKVIYM